MKQLIASLILTVFAAPAFATIDANDWVELVIANVQDDTEFGVQRGPIVGCYGMAQGARLYAWVAEYKATSNVGCGMTPVYENVNALTCAKIVKSKESNDYMSFSEITLDISACPQKDNQQFITMIRTSAARNFPQSGGKEVVLTLIK
ncbi:MAG TPA: hypothetical protein PKC28_16520 [Bdellovibrionales bacterium]|nr:hypothetical protein [Bdellovibrionales bacterium]